MTIRVLIVDDSAFMRTAVSRLLESDSRFTVCGQASNGAEAVKLARELKPDALTMDFNMPGMNGAEATRAILSERAVPIVMLSAHTRDGTREAVAALAAGAVDTVAKPSGEVSANLSAIRADLTDKLALAAKANVQSAARTSMVPDSGSPRSFKPIPAGSRVVVVASSTGGPAALSSLLPNLKLRDAALVLVQHMPAGFTEALANQLAEAAGYPISEAAEGQRLVPGQGVVAPGGKHLVVHRGGDLSLSDRAPVHGVRPAADVTFKSLATAFGSRCIAVVLTGMGRDGALGTAAVKAAGGRTLAQDKATSVVYGMPKAAYELGVVDTVAPLGKLAVVVNRMLD